MEIPTTIVGFAPQALSSPMESPVPAGIFGKEQWIFNACTDALFVISSAGWSSLHAGE